MIIKIHIFVLTFQPVHMEYKYMIITIHIFMDAITSSFTVMNYLIHICRRSVIIVIKTFQSFVLESDQPLYIDHRGWIYMSNPKLCHKKSWIYYSSGAPVITLESGWVRVLIFIRSSFCFMYCCLSFRLFSFFAMAVSFINKFVSLNIP